MRNARHGTTYRYREGCRCDPCRIAKTEAHRVYQRTYVRRRREELLRLRALEAQMRALLDGRPVLGVIDAP